MAQIKTYICSVAASLIVLYLTLPAEAGLMKKGGMMMGGGGSGVLEILAAGIIAKLLQDMKGGMGMHQGMQMQAKTKYVPVPIFVASEGGMMMNGWKGGMMMNGWKGGMMNSGWKGGMMGGD